jgi:hypothetical protein
VVLGETVFIEGKKNWASNFQNHEQVIWPQCVKAGKLRDKVYVVALNRPISFI